MILHRYWQNFRGAHWSTFHLGIIWLLAVMPPLIVAAFCQSGTLLIKLAIAIVILLAWHLVFNYRQPLDLRNRSAHLLLQACLFTLLLPISTSYWLFFVTISFGTVFGERVFGGRGFSFINPVVTGLCFYLFSATMSIGEIPVNSVPTAALIPALFALVLFELVSWRTLAAVLIGVATGALVVSTDNLPLLMESTAMGVALLFLAGDPANGGSSNPARWIHGMVCGVLLMLLAEQSNPPFSATIFAIFLASLGAPLIDTVVERLNLIRMRRRYD